MAECRHCLTSIFQWDRFNFLKITFFCQGVCGEHPQNRDDCCPSVPIGDFENTLSFPSAETSLGRRGFPHISPWEMYHARLEPFSQFYG
ncbi:MAG: hypothetical protein WA915_06950, partial [Candidatus Aminicenantaceae bacterium]